MTSARTTGVFVTSTLITADMLLALPRGRNRYELVDGVVRVMELTGFGHGRASARAAELLSAYVVANDLGIALGAETGFVLSRDPDTVRAPDAAFVTRERYEAIGQTQRYWPEAPALAVEVTSPGDTFSEVEEKALMWLDRGVILVLVADPRRRTITAYRGPDDIRIHGDGEVVDASTAVPGWTLPVADLFR